MVVHFAPVDRRIPVATQIYDRLRLAIVRGHLAPGKSLSEKEIAEQFATSRTPAREAFIRLSEDGLVDIIPQYGTIVSRISLPDVADSQLIREALETVTTAKAAQRIDADGVGELQKWLRTQAAAAAAGDTETFVQADDGMHEALIRISGHPGVWKAAYAAKMHLDRVRYLAVQDPDWLLLMFQQHQAIVDHTGAHRVEAAVEAMRTHLRTVFHAIDRIAQNQGDVFTDNKTQGGMS